MVYPHSCVALQSKCGREFYANLSSACGDLDSPRFGKVYVRGLVYTFSHELINDLFGLPTLVVSNISLEAYFIYKISLSVGVF